MKTRSLAFCLIVSCLSLTISVAQTIHGHYAIKNAQTGLLLRVQDARKANGTPIVAYSPVNWKCVTPADSKGVVNSRIMLAKKTPSQAQLWSIYEQDPEI